MEPASTVVVFCSDGRLGEHIDEFVGRRLGIDRFDRLVVPGGAACLASSWASCPEGEAVEDQLRFLIDAHDLRRIILIAHKDCGHYTQRLRLRGPAVVTRQCSDLLQAARRLTDLAARPEVEAYYAHNDEDRLGFHRLPI